MILNIAYLSNIHLSPLVKPDWLKKTCFRYVLTELLLSCGPCRKVKETPESRLWAGVFTSCFTYKCFILTLRPPDCKSAISITNTALMLIFHRITRCCGCCWEFGCSLLKTKTDVVAYLEVLGRCCDIIHESLTYNIFSCNNCCATM